MKLPLEIGKYYKDGWGNVLLIEEFPGGHVNVVYGPTVKGLVVAEGEYNSENIVRDLGSVWNYRERSGNYVGQDRYPESRHHLIEGSFDSLEEANPPPVVYAWRKPTTAERALILD